MKGDYFVYTGNAYPHKNLNRLVEAVVKMRGNLKIISGRNEFSERLVKIIQLKNASKYVEILGFVDDQKIKDIYKNSIAFVFPTLAEGFGLPPKEAIEAGTIAIVSNIPVLKEVYGDSVFYFDPLNIDSIASKLTEVTKIDKKERLKIILKSQKYLKKYSWLKMAKETLNVYESVSVV